MTPPLAQEYLEAWGRPELRLGISVVFGYDSNGETHSFIHAHIHSFNASLACVLRPKKSQNPVLLIDLLAGPWGPYT